MVKRVVLGAGLTCLAFTMAVLPAQAQSPVPGGTPVPHAAVVSVTPNPLIPPRCQERVPEGSRYLGLVTPVAGLPYEVWVLPSGERTSVFTVGC